MKRKWNKKIFGWSNFYRATVAAKLFILFMFVFVSLEFLALPKFAGLFKKIYFYKVLLGAKEKLYLDNFQNPDSQIVYDAHLGWVNRPNFQDGNLSFNRIGSRGDLPNRVDEGVRQIGFFGDEYIQGGKDLEGSQSVSKYIDSPSILAHNFGTAYYSVDQVMESLPSKISDLGLNYIVVGLRTEYMDHLDSKFLPLVQSLGERIKMPPLNKPMYTNNQSMNLKWDPIDPMFGKHHGLLRASYSRLIDDPMMVQKLEERSKEFLQPTKKIIYMMTRKLKIFPSQLPASNQGPSVKNFELFKDILRKMNDFSQSRNVELLFLMLPSRQEMRGQDKAFRQIVEFLSEDRLNFIDGIKVLGQQDESIDLFSQDNFFSPQANNAYAKAVKEFFLLE